MTYQVQVIMDDDTVVSTVMEFEDEDDVSTQLDRWNDDKYVFLKAKREEKFTLIPFGKFNQIIVTCLEQEDASKKGKKQSRNF